MENDHALKLFKNHIEYFDSLPFDDRQLELVRALLAGNVFDWGAKEVVALLEAGNGLSFSDALNKLQRKNFPIFVRFSFYNATSFVPFKLDHGNSTGSTNG